MHLADHGVARVTDLGRAPKQLRQLDGLRGLLDGEPIPSGEAVLDHRETPCAVWRLPPQASGACASQRRPHEELRLDESWLEHVESLLVRVRVRLRLRLRGRLRVRVRLKLKGRVRACRAAPAVAARCSRAPRVRRAPCARAAALPP
eukprot:scaffold44138_cov55-Phaeocystis_antarctica.AAC.1